jgi:hypothetical protein
MLGQKAYRFGNFPDESHFTRREQVRRALQWCCYRSQNGKSGLDVFALTGVGHPKTGDVQPRVERVQKSVTTREQPVVPAFVIVQIIVQLIIGAKNE